MEKGSKSGLLKIFKPFSGFTQKHSTEFMIPSFHDYSHLSNKRWGWNKRGGGAKVEKSVNVEVGMLQLESSPFVSK